jgi:hypothetical protein
MPTYNPGGYESNFGYGNVPSLANSSIPGMGVLKNLENPAPFDILKDIPKIEDIGPMKSLGNFFANNWKDLVSLKVLDESLGFQKDQNRRLDNQENRAEQAQNLNTDALMQTRLAMATPGTAEHAALQEQVNSGQYTV